MLPTLDLNQATAVVFALTGAGVAPIRTVFAVVVGFDTRVVMRFVVVIQFSALQMTSTTLLTTLTGSTAAASEY
jgi:hypothetical protein